MAGFRLKMATQLGEKTAADAGYVTFPINPTDIARSKDIHVQAKPSQVKGVFGAMIMAGGNVTILYSSEYNNTGFDHFCVAHELGHYFLPDHPEEIQKQGGTHFSCAGFTQNSSIELEADHFASGLLLPSRLTRTFLSKRQIGLRGILDLADAAECSRTAAAIRSAECCNYSIAVIVSEGNQVSYAFMSDKFKQLGKLAFLRKGSLLPDGATRRFNADPTNILGAKRDCASTDLNRWFDGPRGIGLDEEVIGLGKY